MDDASMNQRVHLATDEPSAGSGNDPKTDPGVGFLVQPGRLMSAVCHDLRSPLSSIVMGVELIQRSIGKMDGLVSEKRVLGSVLRSAERLTSLIADLHDLAQLESGAFVIDKERVEVAAILTAAVEKHAAAAARKGVIIAHTSPQPEVSVRCDRDRAVQMLSELIDNAVRYSPENCTVRIDVEVSLKMARFSVTDEGPGMTEDAIAHAFDASWHASRSPRDGTGLGLALVRGIAAAHGGGASVTRVASEGFRATFWLPVE
jgi:signal transduction histidine kinase